MLKCSNCGHTSKHPERIKRVFNNVWLCGCCREDMVKTMMELKEKEMIDYDDW